MYIPFNCPNCGSFTEVEAQYAGHTGPCFACGKQVTVPFAPPAAARGRMAVAAQPASASLATIGSIMALVAVGIVAFVCLIVLLMWVLGPAMTAGGSAAQQSACSTNLKQIGMALEKYHQKHGSYPPAFTVDAKGRRMHSWRVLILPYLGEQALYNQYDMNQPWDSMQNMQVARRMPAVYACSADLLALDNGETSYLVVVGKGTAFPGSSGIKKPQITDPLEMTALVVESHASGIGWTEPKDLDASAMLFLINGGSGKGGGAQEIASRHADGAHILTADYETLFVPNNTPAEQVEGLLTTGGKDPVPEALKENGEDPFK